MKKLLINIGILILTALIVVVPISAQIISEVSEETCSTRTDAVEYRSLYYKINSEIILKLHGIRLRRLERASEIFQELGRDTESFDRTVERFSRYLENIDAIKTDLTEEFDSLVNIACSDEQEFRKEIRNVRETLGDLKNEVNTTNLFLTQKVQEELRDLL